jgi:hypothetical protein
MGYNEPTDYDYNMICGFVNKWGQQKTHSYGIFSIGSINFKITGFEANVGHIVTTYSESTTRCCVMLDHSGLERETT